MSKGRSSYTSSLGSTGSSTAVVEARLMAKREQGVNEQLESEESERTGPPGPRHKSPAGNERTDGHGASKEHGSSDEPCDEARAGQRRAVTGKPRPESISK